MINLESLLGTMVDVVIDRPIGYVHGRIIYPVNYGYIPGIIAGDGAEQDVYILGVDEPLETFRGRAIAIVVRHNDVEDKLVVVPDGMHFSAEEIAQMVHFQEQFFDTSLIML